MEFSLQQWIIIAIVSVLMLFWFNGCAEKQDTLKPTSEKVSVIEKKVAVACEVPKIDCNFEGKGIVPTKKLLECVKLQKEVIRICTEKK